MAGPTASGKSAVALALAEVFGGEILSADSMQVYRGLDLGTAKPTPDERSRVPHHLIDLVEPDESFDAARWLGAAIAAEAAVRSRGRVPIFCGGTGFYFRAWFEGLEAGSPPDPERRAVLEGLPLEVLLAELEAGDPAVFATIDRRNPRRLVRAVERLRDRAGPSAIGEDATPAGGAPGMEAGAQGERGTGRLGAGVSGKAPTGSAQSRAGGLVRGGGAGGSPGDEGDEVSVGGAGGTAVVRRGQVFVLRREAGDLRRRIDGRVDAMFAGGLIEETRALLGRGLERNRTAMQAIGYRQVVEHLRGERDRAATVALVKTKTWQFARRQMTWFRHQLEARWIEVAADEPAETTAERIGREWGGGIRG